MKSPKTPEKILRAWKSFCNVFTILLKYSSGSETGEWKVRHRQLLWCRCWKRWRVPKKSSGRKEPENVSTFYPYQYKCCPTCIIQELAGLLLSHSAPCYFYISLLLMSNLSAATDTLNNNILLCHVTFGLSGTIFNWFKSYPTECSLSMVVIGITFSTAPLKYRVPQGLVLDLFIYCIHPTTWFLHLPQSAALVWFCVVPPGLLPLSIHQSP